MLLCSSRTAASRSSAVYVSRLFTDANKVKNTASLPGPRNKKASVSRKHRRTGDGDKVSARAIPSSVTTLSVQKELVSHFSSPSKSDPKESGFRFW